MWLRNGHGNVHEWCTDACHKSHLGAATEGSAWIQGGDDNFAYGPRRLLVSLLVVSGQSPPSGAAPEVSGWAERDRTQAPHGAMSARVVHCQSSSGQSRADGAPSARSSPPRAPSPARPRAPRDGTGKVGQEVACIRRRAGGAMGAAGSGRRSVDRAWLEPLAHVQVLGRAGCRRWPMQMWPRLYPTSAGLQSLR